MPSRSPMRVGQRAHVIAGRAHQAQAQRRAAPLDDLERGRRHLRPAAAAPARSCARDRRRDRRRFSWPRRPGGCCRYVPRNSATASSIIAARQFRRRRARDRARRPRRRDRASWSSTPSSMSRFVLLLGGRQKLREARRLADDERQHARRERIERAGVADLRLAGCPPERRCAKDGARMTATTSCDVGPAGLSMTMTPSVKRGSDPILTIYVSARVSSATSFRAHVADTGRSACSRPRSCGRRRRIRSRRDSRRRCPSIAG